MKKVSVVLTNGLPLSFDAEPHEVNELRELMREGKGVFSKLDFVIPIRAVTLLTVTDVEPEEGEKEAEEDCNS